MKIFQIYLIGLNINQSELKMEKWYTKLLRKIKNFGSQIFVYDSNNLLNDKNFLKDLSSIFNLYKYIDDGDCYQFINKNKDKPFLIYSHDNIKRTYLKNKVEINLYSIFPDLDIDILKNMDVSYLQEIYNYYRELKSNGISEIDTKNLIYKSVWKVDIGSLYSPTNNLKITLDYLINNKELDKSILNKISSNLDINIDNLKENKLFFYNWIEQIILNFITEPENNHKFNLDDNLIQFYLSKLDLSSDKISDKINEELIVKYPWLSTFKIKPSNNVVKNKINVNISFIKEIYSKIYNNDNIDLNDLNNVLVLSKKFFNVVHDIQIRQWNFDEFLNIEVYYQKFNDLFRDIIELNLFDELYSYPYNKKPFTVNKILDYVFHNFGNENIALIVFDGMSFDEWYILKNYLDLNIEEEFSTFAILPTITSLSRTSIFSGKLPKNFIENKKIVSNAEIKGFNNYLIDKNLEEFLYGKLDLNNDYLVTKNDSISFEYLQDYNCLGIVCNLFDDAAHSTNIFGEYKSSLYKNIQNSIESSNLINFLNKLKEFGYKIIITSDHGNIYSKGNNIVTDKNLEIGKRKSNRVLIYDNEVLADEIVENHPNFVKYNSNNISNDLFFVLANENYFFGKKDKYSITHGSYMPEEWIVPVVVFE